MTSRKFTVPCIITVEHSMDSLEAHVHLDNGIKPALGDKVCVHGSAITVPYGESITIHREATVTRATKLEKLWLRIRSQFELTELYEVSFSTGRL